MTKNILKLSAAVIIGLYAQAAHATNTGWTAEEYEALRRGESASWKYIGKEAVDAGGDLDDLVTQLGTGGVDVLKAKLGIPGATSAEDDLDGLIDRVDVTANQTLAGAITAVKNAINTGVPGDSLLVDIQNEAIRANGAAPVASLKDGIDARIAANPFPGAGLALIPTVDATTALADLTAQRDRIDNTAPASISAALDNVDALVPPNAALVQDLTAIRGTIDGAAAADIPAAIAAQATALTNTGGATIADGIAEVRAFVPTANASIAEDLEAQRVLLDNFLADNATNANSVAYAANGPARVSIESIIAYLLTRTVN